MNQIEHRIEYSSTLETKQVTRFLNLKFNPCAPWHGTWSKQLCNKQTDTWSKRPDTWPSREDAKKRSLHSTLATNMQSEGDKDGPLHSWETFCLQCALDLCP